MAEESKAGGFGTFLTVVEIIVGLAIVYYIAQFMGLFKKSAAKIEAAAGQASEDAGYATSEGQNDPYIAYNNARIAYATEKGYAPGTADFRDPPGFPTFDMWSSTNNLDSPSYVGKWIDSFWGAL